MSSTYLTSIKTSEQSRSYGTFRAENKTDEKIKKIEEKSIEILTLIRDSDRYSLAFKILNFVPVIGWLINLFIYAKMDSLETDLMLKCSPFGELRAELSEEQFEKIETMHPGLISKIANLSISRLSLNLRPDDQSSNGIGLNNRSITANHSL